MSTKIDGKEFITSLNLIRLRAQDLTRDLKALEMQAIESGLVDDMYYDPMYDLDITLTNAAREVDNDFRVENFVDIGTPEGMAMLINEESNQVQEKVVEMAQMTGVSIEDLGQKGLYSGFNLGDAADYMYGCFAKGTK